MKKCDRYHLGALALPNAPYSLLHQDELLKPLYKKFFHNFLPIPDSRFLIPVPLLGGVRGGFRFPIPDSRFPAPSARIS
ncbi:MULTISPECIES: hypothetical protein [Moorena]|uniref:hypothetical protein n=1 Tax=Moorena TaxID=1155738 RepID=UPI0002F47711|nr:MULTISPECIES: hypothetical protein [Moorena]NEQ15025.1 hypothetical protein [Moorena sp. SIO3E2]NEP30014.1 hypothetical protein [Moorena sp. SIO3B2]NEP65475.1 hypothetical protein [Moorena sp. SIO3A5]NER85658.1 hypothetical protein [Moorena sp. SIO3A2]NES45137.1 hypothetical protein [Moorena sp. SIO2C4]